MMNAADRAMAEAIQAEIVDLKRRFHNLQHSLTPDHPYRYFMTSPDGRRQFWIRNYISPNNSPIAGIVRFKDSALTGETRADGAYWENIPSILRATPQWIWLSPSHKKSNPTRKSTPMSDPAAKPPSAKPAPVGSPPTAIISPAKSATSPSSATTTALGPPRAHSILTAGKSTAAPPTAPPC